MKRHTRASFSITENNLTDRSAPTDSIHTTTNAQLTAETIVLPVDLANRSSLFYLRLEKWRQGDWAVTNRKLLVNFPYPLYVYKYEDIRIQVYSRFNNI